MKRNGYRKRDCRLRDCPSTKTKLKMGQELVVLGVALSTTVDRQGSAALTQLVTEKRRKRIVSKCLELMHHKGSF